LNSIDLSYSSTTPNTKDYNEKTVYLGDLDIETSEKQIQYFFDSNSIPTLKIVKQPHSSYAHVTFQSSDIAKYFLDMAIIRLNSRVIRVMPFNQPNNFEPDANLIIKNLEAYLNESDIIKKFRHFGEILSCKLVRDERGESKCYAYLQYKERASASSAIDNLNNTYWDERCDPDFKYKKFQEKLFSLKTRGVAGSGGSGGAHYSNSGVIGKLNESDMEETQLYNDYYNKMGKKIYVGIFKKRNEYSKIKSDKEGKLSNLYVKNFGVSFGDRDLFNLFKSFGSIKSAKVRRLKVGLVEKPLGCGFVDFENPDEAEKAREALDGYMLSSGRKISVTYADCKSRRLRKKLEENNNGTTTMNQSYTSSQSEFIMNSGSNSSSESLPNDVEEKSSAAGDDESPVFTESTNDDLEDFRNRKISLSSDSSSTSSNYSLASSFGVTNAIINGADSWSTWTKLLNTSNWNEYRLFADDRSSLF
jgi:RNA recognition motif-containing protein